jgi:hypothetical protein
MRHPSQTMTALFCRFGFATNAKSSMVSITKARQCSRINLQNKKAHDPKFKIVRFRTNYLPGYAINV